jgi:thioredoxin 1
MAVKVPAVFDTPVHTNAHNLERVLGAGRPALLVFEMPGCEPCRTLEPTLEEMARAFVGRALIVRVDNVEEDGLAGQYRVTRVPTLVFWRDGREVVRIEGAAKSTAVRTHLEFLTGRGPRPGAATGPSVALHGTPGSAPARPAPQAQDGKPMVVTDATFEDQVLKSSLPVMVDFWAPWCGPCRMVSPIVEQLGSEYAGRLRVAKVNTDDNPAWASRLGIRGIPTLILFRQGREVDRVVGAAPKAMLKSRVERVLSS